jgi:hypothetical protein
MMLHNCTTGWYFWVRILEHRILMITLTDSKLHQVMLQSAKVCVLMCSGCYPGLHLLVGHVSYCVVTLYNGVLSNDIINLYTVVVKIANINQSLSTEASEHYYLMAALWKWAPCQVMEVEPTSELLEKGVRLLFWCLQVFFGWAYFAEARISAVVDHGCPSWLKRINVTWCSLGSVRISRKTCENAMMVIFTCGFATKSEN